MSGTGRGHGGRPRRAPAGGAAPTGDSRGSAADAAADAATDTSTEAATTRTTTPAPLRTPSDHGRPRLRTVSDPASATLPRRPSGRRGRARTARGHGRPVPAPTANDPPSARPALGRCARTARKAAAGRPLPDAGAAIAGATAAGAAIDVDLPIRVTPGQPVEEDVRYVVTERLAAAAEAGLPFLDVTLRNTRAIQAARRDLGPHDALDLARNQRATRPMSDIRTPMTGVSAPDSDVR